MFAQNDVGKWTFKKQFFQDSNSRQAVCCVDFDDNGLNDLGRRKWNLFSEVNDSLIRHQNVDKASKTFF